MLEFICTMTLMIIILKSLLLEKLIRLALKCICPITFYILASLTKISYHNSFHNLSPIDIKSAEIIMRNIIKFNDSVVQGYEPHE